VNEAVKVKKTAMQELHKKAHRKDAITIEQCDRQSQRAAIAAIAIGFLKILARMLIAFLQTCCC